MKDKRCRHINRVSVHPCVTSGVSIGRCENEALPGMVLCEIHADRYAMGLLIRTLTRRINEAVKIEDACPDGTTFEPMEENHE